jgi:hypothetical protein
MNNIMCSLINIKLKNVAGRRRQFSPTCGIPGVNADGSSDRAPRVETYLYLGTLPQSLEPPGSLACDLEVDGRYVVAARLARVGAIQEDP